MKFHPRYQMIPIIKKKSGWSWSLLETLLFAGKNVWKGASEGQNLKQLNLSKAIEGEEGNRDETLYGNRDPNIVHVLGRRVDLGSEGVWACNYWGWEWQVWWQNDIKRRYLENWFCADHKQDLNYIRSRVVHSLWECGWGHCSQPITHSSHLEITLNEKYIRNFYPLICNLSILQTSSDRI